MPSAPATGLHGQSDPAQFVLHIDRLTAQVFELQQQGMHLFSKNNESKKKDLTEQKAFDKVPKYGGNEKEFGDFEFKLQQLLRPYKHFEEFIDWIKNEEEETNLDALTQKARAESQHDPTVDLHWYDEQLYTVMTLLLTDTPLQTVKNLREYTGVRGCKAWHQVTREVAGRTGVRLERLAD